MKRGGIIARRTPLASGAAMERGGPIARGKPLRKVGKRSKRDAPAVKAFREAVLARAKGKCERCGEARPLHAHHRKSRAQGGGHEPSNGAALCAGINGCHMRAHRGELPDNAKWIESRKSA